jgi:hypothetical protein
MKMPTTYSELESSSGTHAIDLSGYKSAFIRNLPYLISSIYSTTIPAPSQRSLVVQRSFTQELDASSFLDEGI